MHRSARTHHLASVLLAGVVLVSPAVLMSTAGGCKAIREKRAQKAAQREQRALPNQDRGMSASQQEWLARQPIAQNQPPLERAAPSEEPAQEQANDQTQDQAQDQTQDQTQGQPEPEVTAQGESQTETQAESPSEPQPEPDPVRVTQAEPEPAPQDNSPTEPQGDDARATETPSGMRVVDERANPVQAEEPEITIAETTPAPRKLPRDQASYEQAVQLHADGDLQAALRELERAIAFNPQFTLAYLESGDILMELAQYDQAERQYALAVRNEPRNYMAQYRHAQVLHRLDRLDASYRAYLRALSIRPGSFDANLGISVVLLEQGRAEQSLPYAQRAVRSEPPSGRARMHLGNVYAALDRDEEAVIEYLQAAEMMDAPTPGLLLNMAESLNQLQRYAEMVGALDQLVRIDPTEIAYERLGSALFRLKRYDDALAAFRESSEIDPDYYPAFNGIAVCELNQYLWSSKTDGGARVRAVDAMRQSLRIDTQQPRIVELLRRYKDPSGTER